MDCKYTIIPQKDFFTFRDAHPELKCRRALDYTDGTTKVVLEKIAEEDLWNPEELSWETDAKRRQEANAEWEATRQQYLKEALSNGRQAVEGEAYGYLSDNVEHDTEPLLWVVSYFLYDENKYWINNIHDNLAYLRMYHSIPFAEKPTQPKLAQSLKRWQKQYWEGGRSIDTFLRRIEHARFLYEATTTLTLEDKTDYVGHAFGLLNTGCAKVAVDMYGMHYVEFDKRKTVNYVEEHFIRRIMSADVALRILRKIRLCARKDYIRQEEEDKRERVREVLEKVKTTVFASEREKIQMQKKKARLQKNWPEIFEIFGDCEVYTAAQMKKP